MALLCGKPEGLARYGRKAEQSPLFGIAFAGYFAGTIFRKTKMTVDTYFSIFGKAL